MTDWKSWLGRSVTRRQQLDAEQANRMNATLDREPTFADGDQLPPAWHWLYFHDLVRASDLGEDGHPRLGITMPPVPLPRRMWAGGRLTFQEPLHIGQTAERVSRIAAITPKQGTSGPLFFVTVEHEVCASGSVRVREEQTIVYREMTTAGRVDRPEAGADPAAHASDPDHEVIRTRWQLNSTALFRYSALTCNGHRIHYDADYCRQVEGYPDLVVHGPLLATLLLDHAVRHDLPVRDFRYRAVAPVFLPHGFTVSARPGPDGTQLRVDTDHGALAMTAELR